ncbi:hypothetical protein [Cupriavidus sp. AU9028]|uniref:hypothetical protein n=1 Tax=Cupriavidus sp. AU9028 TaxID=2871157 RepID=UPI001C957960|nr:hypothetical protein [Cupriavidus sp. AU9028]MBY4898383.1 hypothetical protein [Cupriavidus sp. AU9028]
MQLDFTRAATGIATDRMRRSTGASTTTRRRKKVPVTYWERGYRSHYYRNERGEKLGEVRLSERGEVPVVYRWSAGNYSGAEGSLAHARMRVEETVGFGMRQLPLF